MARPSSMVSCDHAGCAMPMKAPASARAGRYLRTGFAIEVAREVQRQARRHDVPEFAHRRFRRVQFGADQRGEVVGAEGPRVGDGEIEVADEMLGQLHEVVARVLVGIDDRLRLQSAIGQVRMGVQVSAPEAAGGGEGSKQACSVPGC